MENNIKRSIIIPAYAEENFIASTLNALHEFLKNQDWLNSTEVIVVTADAQDRTISIVAEEIKNFPFNQHIKPEIGRAHV